MDQGLLEIFVLALIAGFVLFRLYVTLGRRTGEEREPRPAPVQGGLSPDVPLAKPAPGPAMAGESGAGLTAIMRADPNFDPDFFVAGAKAAYEMIVSAFAKGDREALRDLLTQRVFDSYAAAIDAREANGGAGPELVRLKSADIADAALQGDIARVTVKFESELAEGATGIRDAREKWTFERDVRSQNPNWRLGRVTVA
ncbi:MAG: Tim44/TimA family putative adaptor protein [Hyphomonadaceae bacterium]|nr:Tim44/TimA family putative adaptor protein [Hyphomonadaceae bacterium]